MRIATVCALSGLILIHLWPTGLAAKQKPASITLASTPDSIPAITPNGQVSPPDRPGFRVEVLREAGKRCGVEVKFAAVPWARALLMVKEGNFAAAFSTTYSEERAGYGAFPTKNGLPDATRAIKGYTYSLYVHPHSTLIWNGHATSGASRQVIVERGSAAVDIAVRLGLNPIEVTGYRDMVPMLAAKRADAMIGIDTYVNQVLKTEPLLAPRIKILSPPLEAKFGYLMFGKSFYAQHPEIAECIWNALRDIRATPDYRNLVKSYNNGKFIE